MIIVTIPFKTVGSHNNLVSTYICMYASHLVIARRMRRHADCIWAAMQPAILSKGATPISRVEGKGNLQ